MFCPQCGKQVGNEGNFCMHCGYNLSTIRKPKTNAVPTYIPTPSPTPSQPVSTPVKKSAPKTKEKGQEDIFMGCVGAVLGAVVAGILITLFTKLGVISTVFGAGIAMLCIIGYEMLGGKTSNVTLVVTFLMCLVTPYIADRAAWALVVKESMSHISLWEAFLKVPELVGVAIDEFEYAKDLVLMYFFTVAGAIGTVKTMM